MMHDLSVFFLLWLYQGPEVTALAGEPSMWPEMNPAWMLCPHKAASLCEMSWLTQLLAIAVVFPYHKATTTSGTNEC